MMHNQRISTGRFILDIFISTRILVQNQRSNHEGRATGGVRLVGQY